MRVALINPNSNAIGRKAATNPQLGLLYIASYLRKYGFTPVFVDADVDDLGLYSVLDRIRDCSVVGVSFVSQQAPFAYKLIDEVKRVFPEKTVVIGGSHVSGFRHDMPLLFSENHSFDFAVYGEGEKTMLEICSKIVSGEGPDETLGLAFRIKNGVVVTNRPQPYLNINDIPFPAVDLALPLSRYRPIYNYLCGEQPFVAMATRGCSYKCSYCGANLVWGRKVRFRSAKNVCEELVWLHSDFGVNNVFFMDDMLNFSDKWLRSLCEEIICQKINGYMRFGGSVRANKHLCNADTFRLAKKAGFYLMGLGAESGCQRILDAWNKNLRVEDTFNCVKMLKNLGFTTIASFITGNPYETKESLKETLRFAKRLGCDYTDFPLAVPLMGTEFRMEAEKMGLIECRDYSKWGMANAAVRTLTLTRKELEDWRAKAFYSLKPFSHKLHINLIKVKNRVFGVNS